MSGDPSNAKYSGASIGEMNIAMPGQRGEGKQPEHGGRQERGGACIDALRQFVHARRPAEGWRQPPGQWGADQRYQVAIERKASLNSRQDADRGENMTMAVTPPTTANSSNVRAQNSAGRSSDPADALVKMPAKDSPTRSRARDDGPQIVQHYRRGIEQQRDSSQRRRDHRTAPTARDQCAREGSADGEGDTRREPTSWVSKTRIRHQREFALDCVAGRARVKTGQAS